MTKSEPAEASLIVESSIPEIRARLLTVRPRVITFLGYSGAGYEDVAAMTLCAGHTLDRLDARRDLINIGATATGIGAVYRLARDRGFRTTGIVSLLARTEGVALAEGVELVVFVPDRYWGGRDEAGRLTPTSTAMVHCSDELIAIGGGVTAREEWLEGRRLGKVTEYFPADMNHQRAADAAVARGIAPPTNFAGALGEALAREAASS